MLQMNTKSSFPIKSHKDLEWGWNVGLPSLLWCSAQLRRSSCQLYTLAALYSKGISSVLISIGG